MQKGTSSKCASSTHRQMMDNAKNRLDDLQERFSNLQTARKEGRTRDVPLLEEQVYQSLREWKAELEAPSPASSLLEGSLGSFAEEIGRLLQFHEEEDDASSALRSVLKPEPEPIVQNVNLGTLTVDDYFVNGDNHGQGFQQFDQFNSSSCGLDNIAVCSPNMNAFLDSQHFISDEVFDYGFSAGTVDTMGNRGEGNAESECLSYVSPPPAAFMGPKCALWDCTRPAQGSDGNSDYCSSFHATLALNEGPPGVTPVLRPGGIGVKDNLLLGALSAKITGKNVGIPQCEGAASSKSPWNAKEMFDLNLLEGETIREWLFFDKPRRAFDSGNRKQRSLPDYPGRWHESRKQLMKEFGGLKRSYYMDPQPEEGYEWHLFEYANNNSDVCALYRLELKLKGKVPKDSLSDLEKEMGRLTADVTPDTSPSVKGRPKATKKAVARDVNAVEDQKTTGAESRGGSSVH